jgi:hypothetical protein
MLLTWVDSASQVVVVMSRLCRQDVPHQPVDPRPASHGNGSNSGAAGLGGTRYRDLCTAFLGR